LKKTPNPNSSSGSLETIASGSESAIGVSHRQIEAAEELLEIDGVLASGIDTDVEVGLGMFFLQLLQAFLEGLIAGAVLHHGERFGGRLMVGPEEGDTVTVACGIDTDADAVEGRGSGHT